MADDRRRFPRAQVDFHVTVETADGAPWHGRTVNLSPVGIKVAPVGGPKALLPGTRVLVRLPARDREGPLALGASVKRVDPDGIAFGFGALPGYQFRRLRALVDLDLQQQWQDLLRKLEHAHPGAGIEDRLVDSDEELARWQALLDRLGYDSIQLPSDTRLSRQWREFLKRLEAEGPPPDKPKNPRS